MKQFLSLRISSKRKVYEVDPLLYPSCGDQVRELLKGLEKKA